MVAAPSLYHGRKSAVDRTNSAVVPAAEEIASDRLLCRPLKITEKSSDADKAKFDALSEEEQAALVDLTSSATMSLRDSHGDILTALAKSCENARTTH